MKIKKVFSILLCLWLITGTATAFADVADEAKIVAEEMRMVKDGLLRYWTDRFDLYVTNSAAGVAATLPSWPGSLNTLTPSYILSVPSGMTMANSGSDRTITKTVSDLVGPLVPNYLPGCSVSAAGTSVTLLVPRPVDALEYLKHVVRNDGEGMLLSDGSRAPTFINNSEVTFGNSGKITFNNDDGEIAGTVKLDMADNAQLLFGANGQIIGVKNINMGTGSTITADTVTATTINTTGDIAADNVDASTATFDELAADLSKLNGVTVEDKIIRFGDDNSRITIDDSMKIKINGTDIFTVKKGNFSNTEINVSGTADFQNTIKAPSIEATQSILIGGRRLVYQNGDLAVTDRYPGRGSMPREIAHQGNFNEFINDYNLATQTQVATAKTEAIGVANNQAQALATQAKTEAIAQAQILANQSKAEAISTANINAANNFNSRAGSFVRNGGFKSVVKNWDLDQQKSYLGLKLSEGGGGNIGLPDGVIVDTKLYAINGNFKKIEFGKLKVTKNKNVIHICFYSLLWSGGTSPVVNSTRYTDSLGTYGYLIHRTRSTRDVPGLLIQAAQPSGLKSVIAHHNSVSNEYGFYITTKSENDVIVSYSNLNNKNVEGLRGIIQLSGLTGSIIIQGVLQFHPNGEYPYYPR